MPAPTGDEPRRQTLDDFEILREIGRGGMGIVYEARQVSLDRKVALKVLRGDLGLSARALERFRREAAAAARLHHTNIVPVYASGIRNDTPYFVMELIEGPSLDRILKQLRQARRPAQENVHAAAAALPDTIVGPPADHELPAWIRQTIEYTPAAEPTPQEVPNTFGLDLGDGYCDTVARLIAGVAEALDFVHRHGVIHRDIKPANLLLAPEGRLTLNDFGLARLLDEPGVTMTGECLGTPAYMSPQQVSAGRGPLDHRTDIYSLGATLYEMLTLRPPVTADSREKILTQILQDEPTPPRQLNPQVPLDLETICLKALEKDPARRYQTAGLMADDLRRYLHRFAIAARRAGPLERLRKWAQRRPALAATVAVALVLGGVAGFFGYQAHQLEQRRQLEEEENKQRLRAGKRQAALEKALLSALGGDFVAAERSIAEAELLGATTGEVRMMRGQVELQRGNYLEAIQDLKQAAELMPQRVAPRAMLAIAYFVLGDWEKEGRYFEEIERLPAQTADDLLFKGYARALTDPKTGLQELEEAQRQHPCLLAHLLCAHIRTRRSQDTGQLLLAQQAVQDLEAVRRLLPDNADLLRKSLFAHMAAAAGYREAGRLAESQSALAEAGKDAKALRRFLTMPNMPWSLWKYYRSLNQEALILDDLRRASAQSQDPSCRYAYAMILYRRGELEPALAVLERQAGNSEVDMARLFVLAELPDGPARVRKAHQQLTARYKDGSSLMVGQAALRLLGRQQKEEAINLCRAYRKQPSFFHAHWGEFRDQLLAYNAGELAEDELCQVTAPSRRHLCYAHFFIGMNRLADGDRVAARAQLRKAVATGAYFLFVYDVSQILLDRLDNDLTWPPWIPNQE